MDETHDPFLGDSALFEKRAQEMQRKMVRPYSTRLCRSCICMCMILPLPCHVSCVLGSWHLPAQSCQLSMVYACMLTTSTGAGLL